MAVLSSRDHHTSNFLSSYSTHIHSQRDKPAKNSMLSAAFCKLFVLQIESSVCVAVVN